MTAKEKGAKDTEKTPARPASTAPVKPSGNPSGGRREVPQPHGGVLVPGAGGGPQPGSGRPKNEFKEWCVGLLDNDKNRTQVEEILADKAHPAYATMFRTIADRAHGKPKEHVEHSFKDMTPEERTNRLAAILNGARQRKAAEN